MAEGEWMQYLPAAFLEVRILALPLWQWMGLLAALVVAAVLSWLVVAVVVSLLRPVVSRSRTVWDEKILNLVAAPARLGVAVALFSAASHSLHLPAPALALLAGLEKTVTIVAVTWALLRVVAALAEGVESHLVARGQTLALSVVPLGRRTVQVMLLGLASLAVLQNLGVNVTGLLAGFGIGGLAVALAAQKTVENLFGGITLIADQPVRVGDFCRFGETLGIVEEVGLRSTRVRTLDRTVVTIANAEFAAMQIENYTRRDRIRFYTTLGLRYETTPDQLRYVLVELKKLLLAHPAVDPDPARPRFVGFGAYSLDIEIFAYIRTADYDEFLAIREDILLRIMDLVTAAGTGFAFPSRTVYAAADSGVDADRTGAAEESVREWRRSNALGLPRLSAEESGRLPGTLKYPPEGSATGR